MTAPTPAISSFTDGVVTNAAALNSLGSNLTNLYAYTQGGFRTQKPQVSARVASATFSIPNNSNTLVNFDTSDINTDNIYSGTTPTTLTIHTAGNYFLHAQSATTAGFSTFAVYLCVNGTNPSSNGIGTYSAQANCGQASAFVTLAAGATVSMIVYQNTGAAVNLATTYGATRLSAFFVSP